MDAPAALKTIATRKLSFTDPGAIYLDGKNVLSLVVEIDARVLGARRWSGWSRRPSPGEGSTSGSNGSDGRR